MILMQQNFERVKNLKPMKIFDETVCNFLNELSHQLLTNPQAKIYSDVITFGFWIRRASIKQMKLKYEGESRLGRGIIFHIAPSNVAVNFAYSLTVGLLSGNANVIRLPSKYFPQVEIICNAINETLKNFVELKDYINLIHYAHEKEITDELSKLCDIRVIWGGDETINAIRQSPLKVKATEIVFVDRYSIAIINAENYLKIDDKIKVARDFYNDTYLTDQNACTSPKLIVWLGDEIESAQNIFYDELQTLVNEEYEFQAVQAVDKLVKFYMMSTNAEIKLIEPINNKLTRIEVYDLSSINNFDFNSGLFLEYKAKSLSEILPICAERMQTISCIGIEIETLKEFVMSNQIKGADRITKVGQTLDFNLNWDGYDLIRTMSRLIG